MKRPLASLSFCAALSASVSASRAADACSRSPCDTAQPVPLSGGGNVAVPANATVFGLFAGASVPAPAAGDLSLRRTDVDEVIPLSVVDARSTTGLFLLALGAPLAAGSTYRFTTPFLCAPPGPGSPTNRTTGITVTPAAPLPTALGAVALAAPATMTTTLPPNLDLPTCGNEGTMVYRNATLTLDASAEPWRGVLRVQLYVDGAPRGPAQVGLARLSNANRYDALDFPYTVCAGTAASRALGLAPGSHRFEFRGRVLGGDVELRTPVVEGRLDCAGADGGASGDGGGEGGLGCAATPGRRGDGAGLAAAWMLALARRRRPSRSRREA